jgi:hypothetical protein
MIPDEVDPWSRQKESRCVESSPAAALRQAERAREVKSRAARIFLIMAIAPTATDMPQNELHENNNLEAARV